jgi:hypothetical protein
MLVANKRFQLESPSLTAAGARLSPTVEGDCQKLDWKTHKKGVRLLTRRQGNEWTAQLLGGMCKHVVV